MFFRADNGDAVLLPEDSPNGTFARWLEGRKEWVFGAVAVPTAVELMERFETIKDSSALTSLVHSAAAALASA